LIVFKDVELLTFLSEVVHANTKHYRSDFLYYDIDMVKETAARVRQSGQPERLLFMSRDGGTACFREHDVFLKDTSAFNTWKYHAGSVSEHPIALAVEVNNVSQPTLISGDVYQLDYECHIEMVCERAEPPFIVDATFTSGETKTYDWEYWKDGHNVTEKYYKQGKIANESLYCANESDLSTAIASMHEELFGTSVEGNPRDYIQWLKNDAEIESEIDNGEEFG
jgi:hypothetical protein